MKLSFNSPDGPKKLSLVTFCDTTAEIGKKWKCDGHMYVRMDRRTDGRKDRET